MPSPVALTSFVGRREELSLLDRLLARERLVTILGPPGVGKTRLAMEHARRSEGSIFCDLTEATLAEEVFAALGSAAGLRLAGGADSVGELGRGLAARGPVLVVLDNFEHLVGGWVHRVACPPGALAGEPSDTEADSLREPVGASERPAAKNSRGEPERRCENGGRGGREPRALDARSVAAIGAWLQAAPSTRFLVTSRERLRCAGEVVVDLEPLPLPSDEGEASEAVQLFVERALAVRPGQPLQTDEVPAVRALVRALDGLPLAIELAAARTRVMSAGQLLSSMSRRFDLLAAPGAGARAATLRGAIDWSWNLLAPCEKAALAQASVFRGAFDLAAAEAVLVTGAPSVLDVVQALCDKSLLHVVRAPELPCETRLSLYASIREYAAEKLEASGDRPATEARHATHTLSMAARCGDGEGVAARRRLAALRDNLVAVHRRALTSDPARAIEAAIAIDPLLATTGPFDLRLSLLGDAIEAARGTAVEPRLMALALDARADALRIGGRLLEANRDLEAALELAPTPSIEARILATRAKTSAQQGRFSVARADLKRALRLCVPQDRPLQGRILGWLATMALLSGALREAAAIYQRALEILGEVGDRVSEGVHQGNLAALEHRLGNLDRARSLYEKAIETHRETGNRWALGWDASNLALLSQEEGRIEDAQRGYAEALRVHRETGDGRGEAVTLEYLGTLHREMDRPAEARETFEQALRLHRALGDASAEALVLACLGALDAAEGCLAEAQARFDAADRGLAESEPSHHRAAVAVYRAHLAMARARVARDPRTAKALRDEALRRVADATELVERAPEAATSEQSSDLRLAIRSVERERSRTRGAVLTVCERGAWARMPDGTMLDLARRKSLRLLLLHVARRRVDAPGQATSVGGLVAAGWPGESIHPELGAGRVYAALSSLRRMGLRPYLLARDDGYLIDPEVGVDCA